MWFQHFILPSYTRGFGNVRFWATSFKTDQGSAKSHRFLVRDVPKLILLHDNIFFSNVVEGLNKSFDRQYNKLMNFFARLLKKF